MSGAEVRGWFVAATIISILVGFFTSSLDGYKQFGGRYMGVIISSWGRILATLLPFLLYTAISISSSGWSKIFQSPEIAMGAFLILLMSSQELGCALSIRRQYPVERYKISMISMWSLLWLCVALMSVILIFQADQVPVVVIIWQFVLLAVAIPTYFGSAAMVKLVEVGHVPRAKKL